MHMLTAAEKLKSNHVHLITVGVGSGVNSDVLKKMSSSGNVFSSESYADLEKHIEAFMIQLNEHAEGKCIIIYTKPNKGVKYFDFFWCSTSVA